jgi:hypothetical protein
MYFPSLSELEFSRFELAFNACTRNVFVLLFFDHVSGFSKGILSYTLFVDLELSLACFIREICLVGDTV